MPDPSRCRELSNLNEGAVGILNDLAETLDEINECISYLEGLRDGRKDTLEELKQSSPDRAWTFGGFAIGVGGVALAVAAPPVGALFWFGLATGGGGLAVGMRSLTAMTRFDGKTRRLEEENRSVDRELADLRRVRDLIRLP